jgi:hypothetical protein
MSKEETIKVFQSIITAIENDDSFQGSIEYEVIDQNNFEVFAAYRTGNSQGQSGIVLIREDKP